MTLYSSDDDNHADDDDDDDDDDDEFGRCDRHVKPSQLRMINILV